MSDSQEYKNSLIMCAAYISACPIKQPGLNIAHGCSHFNLDGSDLKDHVSIIPSVHGMQVHLCKVCDLKFKEQPAKTAESIREVEEAVAVAAKRLQMADSMPYTLLEIAASLRQLIKAFEENNKLEPFGDLSPLTLKRS